MAWTYASPNPGAEQGTGPVNYYTWRAMRGLVQMRLTDVSINGGARWNIASYQINLITSSGQVLCDTRIYKEWNVPAQFKTLCFIYPAKSVRMQVTAFVYTNVAVYSRWTSELRWDNSATPV